MSTKDDTKIKSWILLFAGLAGMGYQQYTGKVNWILLLTYTVMTGIPAATHIISLLKNSPVVLQSSSSPQEHLERGSENALPNSSEDKK